ncbi:hypothetical protein AXG93_399s1180 [Marchantia polymorpha subsp. ruderalis]|uniref:Uncharacterized protein n=1 Tax=Marchantia polymorpha subsp. ruderalis TaxID=1480154 RepID=A0A176WIN9_MARPO|nr:hypothetical protein AXG93_399s1180 [Marchantia polymorpha subsp. ruderalis]
MGPKNDTAFKKESGRNLESGSACIAAAHVPARSFSTGFAGCKATLRVGRGPPRSSALRAPVVLDRARAAEEQEEEEEEEEEESVHAKVMGASANRVTD